MTMDKICSAAGDVQSRLLDHKPVIQGEIGFFVREFEEKRDFRESRLLEKLNMMVAQTREQALPRCSQFMQDHLFDTITCLKAVSHMTERIQQRELEAQHGSSLQASVERSREEWEEFLKEQTRLKEAVDEKHAAAVGRLSAQYNEMRKDISKLS